jgi:hypothetical protein
MTDEKKHDTSSKRDVIFAWLDEHHEPGMTAHAVRLGTGVGFETARKWLAEWQCADEAVDDAAAAEFADDDAVDDTDEPEVVDAVDADSVTVSRAYLLTLEALRDQVLETQRLRRMLEVR